MTREAAMAEVAAVCRADAAMLSTLASGLEYLGALADEGDGADEADGCAIDLRDVAAWLTGLAAAAEASLVPVEPDAVEPDAEPDTPVDEEPVESKSTATLSTAKASSSA